MTRYRTVEIKAVEAGREQADIFVGLIEGLREKGISDHLIEQIAANISAAASCFWDGCKGMENPAELVSNPIRETMLR